MLEIIKDFLEVIIVPPEERIDQILRQKNLERITQYCERKNLDFVPEEVARLPPFAKKANRFIEARARKSLPQRQFDPYDRGNPRDLSKYVETGGILGYDGSLFEISYSPPDENNIRIFARSPTNPNKYLLGERSMLDSHEPVCIVSSTQLMRAPIKIEDIERAEAIIYWHTHPQGGVPLSEHDADFLEWSLKHVSDKPAYFVVFTPGKNKLVWYQAKSSF